MMPKGESQDDGAAGTPGSGGPGGSPSDPPVCSVWAMGAAADAVGPLEWWPTKRLRPYAARHVRLPPFRDTPSWAILRHLVKESGVREALLVLPDGQVIDGAHRLELAKALDLPEVPVRVLTVPKPLRDLDRLQLETILAVLAVGRPVAGTRAPARADPGGAGGRSTEPGGRQSPAWPGPGTGAPRPHSARTGGVDRGE
jgi:hypothetical protein